MLCLYMLHHPVLSHVRTYSCCWVTKSCPALCKSMHCITRGFPVPHHFSEFAQVHVHWISDTIQPSHPLSPLSLAFNLPQHRIFSNEWTLCIKWPKYWSFNFSISLSNKYSVLIYFKIDWFDLLVVHGTLKSLLQHHSLKEPIVFYA